eukprot:14045540-Alexandrium_andersonii.AAC.1
MDATAVTCMGPTALAPPPWRWAAWIAARCASATARASPGRPARSSACPMGRAALKRPPCST